MTNEQQTEPDSKQPYVPRHTAQPASTRRDLTKSDDALIDSTQPYVPKHTVAAQLAAGSDAEPKSVSEPYVGPEPAPAQPSVARSTALMAVATLASRVTGLIRTMVMAFAIGTTLVASAYQVANNFPTIIFDLVAGGLLSAAFVPLFLLQTEKFGKKGGDRYASNLLSIIVVVMGVLALLLTVFAEPLISTQLFSVDLADRPAVMVYAVPFFRIFAVQIVFYGLGGVFTSILNAKRVFFMPALAPLFNNVVVIASFIAYPIVFRTNPEFALIVLAVGTTLGVVAQFAVQIPAMIKLRIKYTFRLNFKDPAFVETVKIGIPMVIYVVGTLVSFTFRNSLAFGTGENGPATLIYAWTWFQLPHGIIAASLSRAVFTEMSQSITRDDRVGFKHFFNQGLSGTLLIIIPLAGLMCALSVPLIQVYASGVFDYQDVSYVASILSIWVFALPFYSLQLYLFNVFASIRRFSLFAWTCTALCVLQCSLYYLLCNNPAIALMGVPIADFVYYLLATVILFVILRKLIGNIGGRATLSTSARVLIATVIGAGAMAAANHFLPFGMGRIAGAGAVVVYGIVGLLIIFGLCKLMRVSEIAIITDLMHKVTRRLKRSA